MMTIKNVRMPDRIAALPRDEHDRPVPYFVTWVDGKPDFRIVDAVKVLTCYHTKACFVCGQPLGQYLGFVIGPMCVVHRISAEPPSHVECGYYAVQVCPFLANPSKGFRDGNMPEEEGMTLETLAIHEENPGVTAIWVCKSFKPFVRDHAIMVHLSDPVRVEWYSEGRKATRAEVIAACVRGANKFHALASELADGEKQVAVFLADYEKASHYWPQE